ncbi:hypothetical protein [Symbioplanes lichenis]|uniref:hypothetical protein n=1 Tax=Symbioplanes lichenis TaxID=1629072 RepID=UPI00273A45E8|nr:hypothetical protein [Actinoplanes lichenis]
MTICVLGTVLAMAGHFPHRPRLWVPHLIGLVAMVAVALGRGGDLTRWTGAAALALAAAVAVAGLPVLRDRLEATLDAAAMALFVLMMPPMTAGHHHAAPGGPTLIAAVAVLAVWTAGRVGTARFLPASGAGSLRRVNTAGSAAMFAGMTLMLA